MKLNLTGLTAAAALSCALLLGGCAKQTTPNAEATNKPTTTANTTKTETANTAGTERTDETAKNDSAKVETPPAGDSVGVAECDEYIKKYEACLTKIAATSPAAQGPLKQAFDAQRTGFKSAASTAHGKVTLAATCKQAIAAAKASTSTYACEW